MKMSWYPEGDLQFGVFRKNEKQLKYVGKERTHTPSILRATPLGVLNHIAKLTSRKPAIHTEGGDKIYYNHANTLCQASLAPPNFTTMGHLWSNQDEIFDIEKEPDISKKKIRNVYFCVAYSRCFYMSIHKVVNRLKILLTSLGQEYKCLTIDLII